MQPLWKMGEEIIILQLGHCDPLRDFLLQHWVQTWKEQGSRFIQDQNLPDQGDEQQKSKRTLATGKSVFELMSLRQ